MRIVLTLLLIGFLAGCSPGRYRRQADRETYQAIAQHMVDPRWAVPSVSIEPRPQSRLCDPSDPDHPPMPPDDPSAHRYMKHWRDVSYAPWIESLQWRDSLNLSDDDDSLLLTPDRAVELGLIHSREYQTQLEDLYLVALALTLDRFEFDLQWFGGNDTTYEHFGTGGFPAESNTLTTTSDLGFSRNFSRGGQLLVDFANTFVWQFTGPNTVQTSSNLGVTLVQPILRLAGRQVRLEQLTQSERNVLYAVRDFARFRKQFYVDITTSGGGYLSLLLQLQNIRNQEANVLTLEQNLELYDALVEMGTVSGIEADQIFQSYQRGRLALRQAQANFDTSLDSFKITLGMPPMLPIEIDDSLLSPFELSDPAIGRLQEEIDRFLAEYRELDAAPSLDRLKEGFKQLKGYHDPIAKLIDQVQVEMDRWQSRIREQEESGADDQLRRQRALAELVNRQLMELPNELEAIDKDVDEMDQRLVEANRNQGWETLQELARRFEEQLAELFVLETEIRVYLIRLPSVQYDDESDAAIQFAEMNRLDLMNQQALVVDAWRNIRVSANGLQSDLDVVFDADIATEPGSGNPLDFSAAASNYRLGLRFDAPLNRKAEANIYRASLVNYQRARRSYMALKDQIQQAVRRDLRQLETDRLNFEIARESLVVAARQVQQTRDQLLAGERGDSSSTQDVLNALNALLEAKNSLIGIWVSYETNRLQLLLDLEALQLDERGVYRDEHANSQPAQTSDLTRLPPVAVYDE